MKTVTVSIPDLDFNLDRDIVEYIKKEKKVIRRQVKEKFNLTDSSSEKRLLKLVNHKMIKVTKGVSVKIDGEQYRRLNVYHV